MMMKLVILLLVTLLSTVLGAPAVVWKNSQQLQDQQQRFLHSSEPIHASDLMVHALESEAPEASLSVVFLISKGEDGSEQLSELASSGKLSQTFEKYRDATGVYHHVAGIESTSSMVREAKSATSGDRVLEVSVQELNSKLSSFQAPTEMEVDSTGNSKPASKSAGKRARDLAKANVFVVTVSGKGDVSEVDAAISSAIDNEHVNSVVLAGVRSVHEVKHERYLLSKRKMNVMEQEGSKLVNAGRRRLEQQAAEGNDDAANNNKNEDMSGVYYVNMTPNIFSGLLFMLLFIVIAYTGISCMGSIQGGDTFTDKMPSIGREA